MTLRFNMVRDCSNPIPSTTKTDVKGQHYLVQHAISMHKELALTQQSGIQHQG